MKSDEQSYGFAQCRALRKSSKAAKFKQKVDFCLNFAALDVFCSSCSLIPDRNTHNFCPKVKKRIANEPLCNIQIGIFTTVVLSCTNVYYFLLDGTSNSNPSLNGTGLY